MAKTFFVIVERQKIPVDGPAGLSDRCGADAIGGLVAGEAGRIGAQFVEPEEAGHQEDDPDRRPSPGAMWRGGGSRRRSHGEADHSESVSKCKAARRS